MNPRIARMVLPFLLTWCVTAGCEVEGHSGADPGVTQMAQQAGHCGDGQCRLGTGEDCQSCPADCGTCPDVECSKDTDCGYGRVCRHGGCTNWADLPEARIGCCSGGTVYYAEDGELFSADCPDVGGVCAWHSFYNWYDCFEPGTEPLEPSETKLDASQHKALEWYSCPWEEPEPVCLTDGILLIPSATSEVALSTYDQHACDEICFQGGYFGGGLCDSDGSSGGWRCYCHD